MTSVQYKHRTLNRAQKYRLPTPWKPNPRARQWPYAKLASRSDLLSARGISIRLRGISIPPGARGISIPPGVRGISIPPGERNVFQLSPACGRSRRVCLDPSGNYRFQKRAQTEQNTQGHTPTTVSQTLSDLGVP